MAGAEFLPEAILREDAANEGDWRVERAEGLGGSCTDLGSKLIRVPEADSDGRVLTRLHEGLHVRYSTVKPKKSSTPSVALFRQMLEEIRVDTLSAQKHAIDMTHRFDDFDLGRESPLWVHPNSDRANLRAALYYLQLYAQRHSPEVTRIFQHLKQTLADKNVNDYTYLEAIASAIADRGYATTDDFDGVAHAWAEELGRRYDPPVVMEKAKEAPKPQPKPQDEGEARAMETGQEADGGDPLGGMQGGHGSPTRQDTYTLCRHLNRANPGKTLRLPMGAKDRGSEPKLWHRYAEDRQIFSNRRMGGTLLIDASGSMQWDFNKLRKAMREFPAATVAIYEGLDSSGRHAGIGNGTLCIVAENGRWDDPQRPNCVGNHHSGGNGIDLEGLEWLARQRKPRLWLSDSRVCGGVHGNNTPLLRKKCREVGRRGRIARTVEIEHAIAYFRRAGNHRSPALFLSNHPHFVMGT